MNIIFVVIIANFTFISSVLNFTVSTTRVLLFLLTVSDLNYRKKKTLCKCFIIIFAIKELYVFITN